MPSSWPSSPSWSSWRSSSCSPPSPTPSTTSPTACRLTSRRLKHQQDGGAAVAPPSCCLYRCAYATLACLLIASDVHQECCLREDVIDSLCRLPLSLQVSSGTGSAQRGRSDDG